ARRAREARKDRSLAARSATPGRDRAPNLPEPTQRVAVRGLASRGAAGERPSSEPLFPAGPNCLGATPLFRGRAFERVDPRAFLPDDLCLAVGILHSLEENEAPLVLGCRCLELRRPPLREGEAARAIAGAVQDEVGLYLTEPRPQLLEAPLVARERIHGALHAGDNAGIVDREPARRDVDDEHGGE